MIRQHITRTLWLTVLLLAIMLSATPKTFAQLDLATQSLIVVGSSAESAQAAVEAVGAEITHELDIINAVAAELTESQANQLASDARVHKIHNNGTAFTSGAIHTQRDNFSTVAYDNNDGTSDFRSNWVEGKDNDDPSSGNVLIWWGAAYLKGDNVRLKRTANLKDAVDVTLSFDYNRYGFDDENDYVVIEIRYNDIWIELDRFADSASGWVDEHASYDISEYADKVTRIRFRTSKDLSTDDTFKLDNFQVRYRIDDGSGMETILVSDQFDYQTFTGNDGTGAWSGEWSEENDYGNAYFGDVFVWSGNLWLKDDDNSIRRLADLTDATSGTLSLAYRLDSSSAWGGGDAPEDVYVRLEISADYGTTWTELDVLSEQTDDYQAVSYDLAPFLGNELTIRFSTSTKMSDSSSIRIDYIDIEYTTQLNTSEVDLFESPVATIIEADTLHDEGITGDGITVAVIDTGYFASPDLNLASNGSLRVVGQYDAVADKGKVPNDVTTLVSDDDSGHGAHIMSIIANSGRNEYGKYMGIAPDVNLVSVKAFSADGAANYADVIRAIDKVIEYKDTFNIRVLNLSFYSTPQSHYWDDPVAQAVMRAWEAGIVVITGAGNTGPDPLTIGVPGNVPYIITVGAITDNYTPYDTSDDYIPPFSSAGPTYDGFIKPEIVAPGAHILGLVGSNSTLAQAYPQFAKANSFYSLSGTSMSAAVTTGIVALMLDADPSLSPDDVKCRLIDTARTALDENGDLAYSVFQQGAGVVNAYDAVNSTATGCANGGLDISADLNGTEHYIGTAELTEDGTFIVRDENGNENFGWDGQFAGTGGTYFWSGGTYFWSGGTYFWSGGTYFWSGSSTAWTGGTYFWSGGTYFWSGGTYFWSGTELDPTVSSLSTSYIVE